MTRNAVLAWTAQTLNGLPPLPVLRPDQSGPVPVEALDHRPKRGQAADSVIVVAVLPSSNERRFAHPRGEYGSKIRDLSIRLDLYWITMDEQVGGQVFDALLDNIDDLFRGYPEPSIGVQMVDPLTGEQSILQKVGEEIRTAVADPVRDPDELEGLVLFTAQKWLTVSELLAG